MAILEEIREEISERFGERVRSRQPPILPIHARNIASQANPAGSVSGRRGGGESDAPGVHPAGSVTVGVIDAHGRGGGGENDDMPRARRTAARAGGHGGSQVDETRYVILINLPPQPGSRATQDDPVDFAQRALQSAFGGLAPLCYTVLNDNLKGDCPGYIHAAAYTGLVLVIGFAFTGLISKKRAKAAFRVLASTCMAALSISIVRSVSENVYIKSICGIIGTVATLATMAINW